ncbi:hypothetical protein ACFLTT_03465, partial [Chloroflexota bacterium]
EEEVVAEKEEESAQPEEEIVAEKEEESAQPEEEVVAEKEEEPAQMESVQMDTKALFNGEIELFIEAPVELKLVSKLYNYLQTIPELRILYTRGSWDKGTAITVVLEKSMPLINVLLETPGLKITPEPLSKNGLEIGKLSLLTKPDKGVMKGLKLNLEEVKSSKS